MPLAASACSLPPVSIKFSAWMCSCQHIEHRTPPVEFQSSITAVCRAHYPLARATATSCGRAGAGLALLEPIRVTRRHIHSVIPSRLASLELIHGLRELDEGVKLLAHVLVQTLQSFHPLIETLCSLIEPFHSLTHLIQGLTHRCKAPAHLSIRPGGRSNSWSVYGLSMLPTRASWCCLSI